MLFNEMLMKRRKELNMTQDELADKLNISRQSISRWENGECMPDSEKLIRLSDVLGISLDELTGREVRVEPIILEAPEIPRKRKRLSRILLTAAICAAFGVCCFLLGRYLLPHENGGSRSQTGTLTAEEFTFDSINGNGFFEFSFVSNAVRAGTVSFYPANAQAEPVFVKTACKKGIQSAAVKLTPGARYETVVFTARTDGGEQELILLTAVLAEDNGISYNDLTVEGSYRVVMTEDYTAVLPKDEPGEIVGFDGDEVTCAAECLEAVNYPDDDFVVPFDREKALSELYAHIVENYPELSAEEAASLAEALADSFGQIEQAVRDNDLEGLQYHYTEDGALVIDVAKLVDGVLSSPGDRPQE